MIRDTSRKAASVRSLRRTSVPIISAGGPRAAIAPGQILAGVLAMRSIWDDSFERRVGAFLSALGTAPAADLMEYGRALKSLRSFLDAA